VSVLDLDRRVVATTLHVGGKPGLARVSPDGSTVVVSNRGSNSVTIIDADRAAVRAAINICIHPEDIAILPDSSKAFVSCSGSGQVATIALKHLIPKTSTAKNQREIQKEEDNEGDKQGDKLLALLDVGKSPVSLAIKPDGGELIAFNFDAGSISIIETTPNEVSGSYLVGSQPTRGVVSRDNSRLYISNFGSNNIAVYDIDLGKIIEYLTVGTRPDALALSQNQNYLLVLDSGSGDLAVIQKRDPSKKLEPSEYSLLTIIPVGVQPNQIVVKSFRATKLADGR
jgi:YVTN family beta-propeller protein